MSFSEKLKALREENHYTQEFVASRLNVAHSTIAGYETKDRQPSHEKLTILADLFHVSVDYLLDDDVIETSLSVNHFQQDYERYLISHFKHLSSLSKKELLDFLQFLEQRDKSSRNHTT